MNSTSLPENIAIVGMGCILPDAHSPDEFWQNVLAKKVSIGKVVPEHFDVAALFRPDVISHTDKKGMSYTDLFASVKGFAFDGRKYRIPPTIADHMDDNQKVAVATAEQALAGVSLEGVDRERISVFMGSSMIGEKHHRFLIRTDFDKFEHHLRTNQFLSSRLDAAGMDGLVSDLRGILAANTQGVTEDSAPGVLPNIIAARIASVFDFHGHAYVIDAACASGLAAIIAGVQHLVSGESDVVVCGAADMLMGEIGHVYFSGINALSPDGSFPFDERANGFVTGQGGGTLVLKRMSDALRAKDPILAVIAGYGQTSDGKGKAIAAPNSVWQSKTIRRAIEMAGFAPETIELVEAHGTSTKVGDASEIEAMKTCFRELGATAKNFCAVGSAKSNIGHLKSAAGIPGIVKTIQALRHKTLPPSANCVKVSSKLGIEDSPFFVNTEARPWQEKNHPRRAGVSAFGFGGANYHIALEEFRPGHHDADARPAAQAKVAVPALEIGSHLALFSGTTRENLAGSLQSFSRTIADNFCNLQDAALEQSNMADASHSFRLGVVFSDRADFEAKIAQWHKATDAATAKLLRSKGIVSGEGPGRTLAQTSFLLPGQGSQYADMSLDLVRHFPSTRRVAAKIDAWWKSRNGTSVSDMLSSQARGKDATDALLKNTRNTHPALLFGNLVAATLLQDMGIEPAWMIGHSAGEVVALGAAGLLSLDETISVMDARSRAFVEMDTDDFGKMAAVRCDRKRLEQILSESGLAVAIANINSPDQLIVSGPSGAVEALYPILDREGIRKVELNVSHAFHSPVVAPAGERFTKDLETLKIQSGRARVMANETCTEYPNDVGAVRSILSSQVTASVDFLGGIEELYKQGVRLFIEAGPNSVLGNLAQAILKDRDATVVSIDFRNTDSLESLNKALATVFAEGIAFQPIPPVGTARAQESAPQIAQAPTAVSSAVAQSPVAAKTPEVSTKIVYSGVSVGLPGSYKKSFQDDNFQQLFEGRNFIERLTDSQKQSLADLRVTKVEKTVQGPVFNVLESIAEVIQLAGRVGKIDALADYSIDAKEAEHINSAVLHAVAAGYEALRDARIPLVREYAKTNSGKTLPDNWVLPQSMQKRTGVIFAHGFPMVETVIAEVSRHVSHKFGQKLRTELLSFYESLIGQVKDHDAKRLLTDWFALHHARLAPVPGVEEVYTFNHQFIQQLSSLANNRLASYIHALGPNFQINAACSSTCTAVLLAEDMIRAGRADRFLVIGADDPTSTANLPFIGAGFLSTGAASCEADLYKAALPFDLRRNGMIMSAGAVGIVVERAQLAEERGVAPVCELLGTHAFNTAGHHARLDVPRYAEELDEFLVRMESTHGIQRAEMAPKLLYLSHETYTPARGGCSEAEAVALRHAFGERFTQIEVANTKGMTGHTMGASIEDVVAARALETGLVPPVVNHQVVDPALAGLKLSRGGTHSCQYALRMAAGFGSQGNYVLLRKSKVSKDRIADAQKHNQWLASIAGHTNPETEIHGRVLRVKDKAPGTLLVKRPLAQLAAPCQPTPTPAPISVIQETPTVSPSAAPSADRAAIQKSILEVVSEITGYPSEMLELDMEIEADLGIDTVKQATILATLGERFGQSEGEFRISAYPTIGHIVSLFAGSASAPVAQKAPTAVSPEIVAPTSSSSHSDHGSVQKAVLEVVSEITGYPPEMLEPDMEIEADLGVDTVKQATILAMLGERFGQADGEFRISAYPTIGHLIKLFAGASATSAPVAVASVATPAPTISVPSVPEPRQVPAPKTANTSRSVLAEILDVVSQITGYPPEMLEPDMEIEADLGVDTVKQATILATLGERFGQADGEFRISAYPTIGHLVKLFSNASVSVATPDTPISASTSVGEAVAPAPFRQSQCLVPEPLPEQIRLDLAHSSILLWGEDARSLESMRQDLSNHCTRVETLLLPASGEVDRCLQAFDAIGSTEFDTWIDLGNSASSRDLADLDREQAQQELSRTGECRFVLFRHLQERSLPKPKRILTLARSEKDPLGGFLQGLHRSLAKEWGVASHLLEGDGLATQQELSEAILGELARAPYPARATYRDGKRHVYKIADAPFSASAPQVPWTADDTILVTGGGNGIAARVLVAMAEALPCRYLVVGRTAPGEDDFLAYRWNDSELTARKEDLKQKLSASGIRTTPVVVEKEFAKLLKQREIARTLAQVRAFGREVHYLVADVVDETALGNALASGTASIGPITGIVHAAGLDLSRYLEKKSLEEFTLVHRIKTIGALNLLRLCPPESLKLFATFSSISGVFGNAAQTDYAAANAFLDSLVRFLSSRHPNLHATSLAWSGWSQVGMAWRNDHVRENADAMGLHLIDPAQACGAALREFCHRSTSSPILLHRGLGALLDNSWHVESTQEYPLIDRIEAGAKGEKIAHHRFSVEGDEFLNQHRLNKVPLMPGVGFMEWMAEFHANLEAPAEAIRFRDISFHDAFKLHRDQPRDAHIQALPTDIPGEWNMRIHSEFTSKIGNRHQLRDYCAARVSTGSFPAPDWTAQRSSLEAATRVPYSQILSHLDTIPQNVVFGPLFHDSRREGATEPDVIVEWNQQGLVAPYRLPAAQLANPLYPLDRFRLNPCLLDSIHQAGVIHSILNTGHVHLPFGADEFVVIGKQDQAGTYQVRVVLVDKQPDKLFYDIVLLDEQSRICAWAKRSAYHRINA